MEKYDVISIGGGSGGCAAAIRSADLGKKSVIIEKRNKDGIGGTCINRGCIPAKSLLKSADTYSSMKNCKKFGVSAENVTFDLKAIVKKKNSLVKNIRFGLQNFILKSRGIEIIQGEGRCIDNHIVEVETNEGTIRLYGESIVLAAGSEPAEIPAFNIDHKSIVTSDDMLELKELPKSALVVGGGAIGIEFAVFMASLEVDVTMVEMLPNIAATLRDEEMSLIVEQVLEKKGIRVITGTGISSLVAEGDGISAELDSGDCIKADMALISIGRKLNTDSLGIETLGLEMEKGRIKVDGHMRTSVGNVYAVGDIVRGPQLSHKAQREGVVAAEAIAGMDTVMDYDVVPWAIFSKPEIAAVGLSVSEAGERGIETMVGFLPFLANEKANTMQEIEGGVKIVADKSDKTIIGAQIVGAEASILIGELALAVKNRVSMEELSNTIHAHPTLSECIMEASKSGLGKAFHRSAKLNKKRR